MPTTTIQISNVKRKKNNVSFSATSGTEVIERILNINDIDNWDDFANWLINQESDFDLLPNKEKSLAITFHTEIVTHPEFGDSTTIKVVDEVIVT